MRKPLLLLVAAVMLAAVVLAAGCKSREGDTEHEASSNGEATSESATPTPAKQPDATPAAEPGSGESKPEPAATPEPPTPVAKGSGNLYAVFQTSLGDITAQLFEKEAPLTVANFKGLAEGTKEWTDADTGQKAKKPFYNGLCFHRVIPDFMVQGGCPWSNDPTRAGQGGPGYQFQDEFAPNLRFDKVGRLAMANSGPATNGSQFFITVAPTPHLDNKHTIFGQVVKGQDVADTISKVPTNNTRPLKPVFLRKVTFYRASKPK